MPNSQHPQWLSDLEELVNIDSPSGFTDRAVRFVENHLISCGLAVERTHKGALRCIVGDKPEIGFAAHLDTLGAMVSHIKEDGTLGIAKVGAPLLPSFEGEYCRIYTLTGETFSGTLLLNNPSAHVNKEADSVKRSIESMHIRIDEEVRSRREVTQLGIRIGDVIAFDPRFQAFANGFIKSRFLDNKAGCIVLLELARRLSASQGKTKRRGKLPSVELFFSTYEEVGHGGAPGFSDSVTEAIIIDMGVVGKERSGLETHCSICALDSSGPYDYEMRRKLVELAEQGRIPFNLDVYPYYSSDGSAAWRAGNDVRVALIGPGVAASHGVERTHSQGIEATIELCLTYLGAHDHARTERANLKNKASASRIKGRRLKT